MLREGEKLTVQNFYDYSITWLKASDCVLLVNNWHGSIGTKIEIEKAGELDIPIFCSLLELDKWYKDRYGQEDGN